MPMTRQQAELAVDRNPQLRGLGPNREAAIRKVMQMDPDQLVSNVPAGSPLARPATRQTAISAAMGGPEEPRMVTPAAPAPMRAGIPIMAPRPEATAPAPAVKSGYVSPMRLAMKETERELDLLNYNRKKFSDEGRPESPELEVAINLAERRLDQQRSIANAEEGATVDPERAALMARQEGRLKGREEQIARDEKDVYADALIKGGLALMNPRPGNNFLAALSEGLGQGLETYDTAKARAIEERARLGAETDALALQKFDALDKARAAARQSILEGKQIDERELRMAAMTNEQMEKTATLAARIEEKIANARKATTEANYAPLMFESELGVNAARATNYLTGDGGSGGSGGKPASPTAVLEETGKFTRELPELRKKASDAFYKVQKEKDPVKKAQLQGEYEIARDNYRRARDRLASLEGRPTGSPYRRSVTGEIYTGPQRTGLPARPAGAPSKKKPADYPDAKQGVDGSWYVIRDGKTYKVEG